MENTCSDDTEVAGMQKSFLEVWETALSAHIETC